MLATYMWCMRNNNLDIRIAYSSYCPQLTWSMITSNFFDIYQYFSWILLNSLLSLFFCWLTIYLFCHITTSFSELGYPSYKISSILCPQHGPIRSLFWTGWFYESVIVLTSWKWNLIAIFFLPLPCCYSIA